MATQARKPPPARSAGRGAWKPSLPSARRSRVQWGKRVLAGAALGLVCAIFYLSWQDSDSGGVRLVLSGNQEDADAPTSMLRPRYQGADERGRPFTITADVANQPDKDTVQLTNLNADMVLEDTAWLALQANHGVLHVEAKQLELAGNINMFYEGGYELRTQSAQVDIQHGTARSLSPVEGQGPAGTISAEALEVQERGKRLVFNGSVKLILYP